MSFSMTEAQLLDGSKTVTRRLGWWTTKTASGKERRMLFRGVKFLAVRKAMGLAKGEKQHVLGVCTVVSIRREILTAIEWPDVGAEGYPRKTSIWFVDHFCKAMGCKRNAMVTRIEFTFEKAEES